MPHKPDSRPQQAARLWLLTFVASLLAKGACAAYLIFGGARWALLLALPAALGVDVLAASALAVLALIGPRRWAGRLWWALLALLTSLLALFTVANVASFRLTGAPITLVRMLGGDGASITDVELVRLQDLAPAALLTLVVLVAAFVFVGLARPRRWPPGAGLRHLLLAALLGLVLAGINHQWTRRLGYGLGDYPPLYFMASVIEGDDEAPSSPGDIDLPSLFRSRLPHLHQTGGAPQIKKRPRNVILYLAEGTPWSRTSLGGAPLDSTPNLARRARQGVVFRRFYSPYSKSIHAIFSLVCSQYPPPHHVTLTAYNPRIDCGSLPEHLSRAGLALGLFHGGHFSFGGKWKLLGERGFDVALDANDLEQTGDWFHTSWGVDDRAMVAASLKWLDGLPADRPFFALYIPIAPHYPFSVPPDVTPAFSGHGHVPSFLSAVHFADAVFEQLMQGLEDRQLADDTLVIWVADHGEAIDEHPRNGFGSRLIYEENVHVPMVWLGPSLIDGGQQNDRLGSLIDLTPTILKLLDLPADPRHVGRSLLAPFLPARRVVLASYQGRDTRIGFIEGPYKSIHNLRSGQNEYYNLRKDPRELKDLSASYEARMQRYASQAKLYRDGQLVLLRNYPRLDRAKVAAQRNLLSHARARYRSRDSDAWVSCAKPDRRGASVCSGQPKWVSAKLSDQMVDGFLRSCIWVHVPRPGGWFELIWPFDNRLRALRLGLRDVSRRKGGDPVEVEGGWRRADHSGLAAWPRLPLQLTDASTSIRVPLPPAEPNTQNVAVLRFYSPREKDRAICVQLDMAP